MKAPRVGLLLGAGASYDACMPLVWELTEEVKNWLTPEKLRTLSKTWRAQGHAAAPEAIESFCDVLVRKELHYEAILGFLETQSLRHGAHAESYRSLYVWLVHMVYGLLYQRHVLNISRIDAALSRFDGFASLVQADNPLWVFSLNHDLIVEVVAARLGISVNAGYGDEVISLPRRAPGGHVIGELRAQVLSGSLLDGGSLPFAKQGERAINLVKLHGALDVFTFRDGKDLLRLLPVESTTSGLIEMLQHVNEQVFYPWPGQTQGRVKAMNEIVYADATGEMQFLRRTLLTGAFKFDARSAQVLPRSILGQLEANLRYVGELICAGYSFGDSHINLHLRRWLEQTAERRLVIVNPSAMVVPTDFAHLTPQISLEPVGFCEYLDRRAGISRSRLEALMASVAGLVRRAGPQRGLEMMATFGQKDSERAQADGVRFLSTLIEDEAKLTQMMQASPEEMSRQIESAIQGGVERYLEDLEKFLKDGAPEA